MDGEPRLADSHRLSSLKGKFHDEQYRDGYVAAHTRRVLAEQMRNFRGKLSQAEFAEQLEKQKTVIARLENPAYGGWSLRTMLEIARKLNVAVFVRFVDFPTFLKYTGDLSDTALHPMPYEEQAVDAAIDTQIAIEQLSRLWEFPLKRRDIEQDSQVTRQFQMPDVAQIPQESAGNPSVLLSMEPTGVNLGGRVSITMPGISNITPKIEQGEAENTPNSIVTTIAAVRPVPHVA
jgi:hypothetical protein